MQNDLLALLLHQHRHRVFGTKDKPLKVILTVHDEEEEKRWWNEIWNNQHAFHLDWTTFDMRVLNPDDQLRAMKLFVESDKDTVLIQDTEPFMPLPKAVRNKATKLEIRKPADQPSNMDRAFVEETKGIIVEHGDKPLNVIEHDPEVKVDPMAPSELSKGTTPMQFQPSQVTRIEFWKQGLELGVLAAANVLQRLLNGEEIRQGIFHVFLEGHSAPLLFSLQHPKDQRITINPGSVEAYGAASIKNRKFQAGEKEGLLHRIEDLKGFMPTVAALEPSEPKSLDSVLGNTPEKEIVTAPYNRLKEIQEQCKVQIPPSPCEDMWRGESGWEKHHNDTVIAAHNQVIANVQRMLNCMPICYKCHEPMHLNAVPDDKAGYIYPEWHCRKGCE